MFKLWERWGTALGILAVAAWVVAFAIASGGPSTDDSDAKITSWYASGSHQDSQLIGFFVFLAGTLCVIAFFAAVRERLAQAGHSEMGALAFGAGIASAVMGALAIILFVAPAFVGDTGASDVAPATFRMLNDAGYPAGSPGRSSARSPYGRHPPSPSVPACCHAGSGWIGVVVGLVQLGAIFFVPIFLFWAWIVVASALLTWRRPALAPAPTLAT